MVFNFKNKCFKIALSFAKSGFAIVTKVCTFIFFFNICVCDVIRFCQTRDIIQKRLRNILLVELLTRNNSSKYSRAFVCKQTCKIFYVKPSVLSSAVNIARTDMPRCAGARHSVGCEVATVIAVRHCCLLCARLAL